MYLASGNVNLRAHVTGAETHESPRTHHCRSHSNSTSSSMRLSLALECAGEVYVLGAHNEGAIGQHLESNWAALGKQLEGRGRAPRARSCSNPRTIALGTFWGLPTLSLPRQSPAGPGDLRSCPPDALSRFSRRLRPAPHAGGGD
eukprot:scaffold429_cov269-Pinguiococcus_pyrenoidosus.AAC.26